MLFTRSFPSSLYFHLFQFVIFISDVFFFFVLFSHSSWLRFLFVHFIFIQAIQVNVMKTAMLHYLKTHEQKKKKINEMLFIFMNKISWRSSVCREYARSEEKKEKINLTNKLTQIFHSDLSRFHSERKMHMSCYVFVDKPKKIESATEFGHTTCSISSYLWRYAEISIRDNKRPWIM